MIPPNPCFQIYFLFLNTFSFLYCVLCFVPFLPVFLVFLLFIGWLLYHLSTPNPSIRLFYFFRYKTTNAIFYTFFHPFPLFLSPYSVVLIFFSFFSRRSPSLEIIFQEPDLLECHIFSLKCALKSHFILPFWISYFIPDFLLPFSEKLLSYKNIA